jgi:hypothetical protein
MELDVKTEEEEEKRSDYRAEDVTRVEHQKV